MVNFETLGLPEPVLRALNEMGFTEPSPIQAAVVPLLLEGRDALGQAQTGTGKTAAFGIPLVVAAVEGRRSLVLVPTRELAQQVAGEIERIGVHAGVRALALYGGAAFGPQARDLRSGRAAVLVATPGRLRDHIERGTMDPTQVRIVVLDEADEMLKMGFVEEVEAVLDAVGPERQTLLFSATMPEGVVRLARTHMRSPEHVRAEPRGASLASANTEQIAIAAPSRLKVDALVRILAVERPSGTLVFRHTREAVDELVQSLRAKGHAAEALHGGMAQPQREEVLARLRDGRARVVVATDVAARGLDVDTITHVVNLDVPREPEAYVHRIGRTGRAGRSGRSFVFVSPAERGRLKGIERILNRRLPLREPPTDDEVRAATAKHAAEWLRALPTNAPGDLRAAVDSAVADGADPAALAAALLARVAVAEGLAAPKLETRLETLAPSQRFGMDAGPSAAIALDVGRDDGVRPADVVGALANEGGLVGGQIGRIDILPRMCVAEVPADRIDDVLARLQGVTVRRRAVRPRVADGWQFRVPPRQARPARAR